MDQCSLVAAGQDPAHTVVVDARLANHANCKGHHRQWPHTKRHTKPRTSNAEWSATQASLLAYLATCWGRSTPRFFKCSACAMQLAKRSPRHFTQTRVLRNQHPISCTTPRSTSLHSSLARAASLILYARASLQPRLTNQHHACRAGALRTTTMHTYMSA
jgi:hypothetical protein